MKISKRARRDAKHLFQSCLDNGLLNESKARLGLKLVVEKKPRGFLQILSHFHRLIKLDVARRTARIESAAPLAAEAQTEIQNNLTRLYGSGLTFGFNENPALLGGLRIQVGSDVYDSSVQARLNALKDSF